MTKPRVHHKTYASCEGCLVRFAHSDLLVPLLNAIDLVECRVLTSPVDKNIIPGDIVIIEGAPTQKEHIEELRKIRKTPGVLIIAIGTCAVSGGIPAGMPDDAVKEAHEGTHGEYIRSLGVLPGAPLSHYIHVDAIVRGCPMDPTEFATTVAKLLFGGKPIGQRTPVCAECTRTGCLLEEGILCLGSQTVSGCNAICTKVNRECLGCRGLLPEADIKKLTAILITQGFTPEEVAKKLSVYNAFGLRENE